MEQDLRLAILLDRQCRCQVDLASVQSVHLWCAASVNLLSNALSAAPYLRACLNEQEWDATSAAILGRESAQKTPARVLKAWSLDYERLQSLLNDAVTVLSRRLNGDEIIQHRPPGLEHAELINLVSHKSRKKGPMSRTKLRILHISDIHFRSANGSTERADEIRREAPRRALVLNSPAWQSNLQDVLADGPIDLVCLTGDVADWGTAEEYQQATLFLKALLAKLNLPMSRLFVVPGNHDIERKQADEARLGIRDQPRALRANISDWMAGGKHPQGVTEAWRERVIERQASYRAWLEGELGRSELLPTSSPHRRLGYRINVGPELGLGVPVWILGLDTAWLAGDDNDAGKLLVTKDQILLLGTGNDGQPLPGLRLALGHHPLGELADGGEVRSLLADYANLYLHGHQHQPISTLSITPDRHLLELAAGCLFEGNRKDEHPNGCEVIELELDELGRLQSAQLHFRSWSPGGRHWHADSSIYRNAKHGRLGLIWPRIT